MKPILVIPIIAVSFLISCSGNSETATKTEKDSTLSNTQSNSDSAVVIAETELPCNPVIEISNDEYVIEEMLASIQSESTPGQNLSVVMSEDQNLYLEIGYDETGKEESWIINLNVSKFGLEINLEFTDANQDDFKDELVIWWSDSDGNNGMQNGFESAEKGLIIFDVTQRTEILNFVYLDHYSTYSAGENAATDDPDYHAKMADDTDWIICSYSHDIKLEDGEIQISNYYSDLEGEDKCVLTKYADGIYRYNVVEEKYQLKK